MQDEVVSSAVKPKDCTAALRAVDVSSVTATRLANETEVREAGETGISEQSVAGSKPGNTNLTPALMRFCVHTRQSVAAIRLPSLRLLLYMTQSYAAICRA